MPGRVRTNPRIRRVLITYLGAAALVLVVVAIGATLVAGQVARDESLRDAERVAQRTANLVVSPLLGDVLNGNAAARSELDRAVSIRLQDGSITELNVWSRTGTVIYSDEADDIGFAGVMSGPLVRSSYRAGRLYQQAMDARAGLDRSA